MLHDNGDNHTYNLLYYVQPGGFWYWFLYLILSEDTVFIQNYILEYYGGSNGSTNQQAETESKLNTALQGIGGNEEIVKAEKDNNWLVCSNKIK